MKGIKKMTHGNKQILVIGSVNVDHFIRVENLPKPGETVLGNQYDIVGGGKGANQAVACARLGGDTRFIANVGSDAFGASMVEQFAEDGIDVSLIKTVESEKTGVALIFVEDQHAENVIGIVGGANNSLSPLQIRANEDAIQQASYVLLQLEVPIESVEAAVKIARKHQTKVMLNPAPASPLTDELLKGIDIIVPNQSEAEILTGIEVNDKQGAEKAARVLHERGIETVIITMGKDGAYLSSGAERGLIPPR